MIRTFAEVTQSRVGAPAGNCTEATIASLLDVALEDVPQLWSGLYDTDDPQPDERWRELLRWLREEHGRLWAFGVVDPGAALPVPIRDLELPSWLGFDRYHLISGRNPDGVRHYCVGFAGELVWDPNPSRRGLVGCDGLASLVALDHVPRGMRDWPWLTLRISGSYVLATPRDRP